MKRTADTPVRHPVLHLVWRLAVFFVFVVLIWLFLYHVMDGFFGTIRDNRVGHLVRAVTATVLAIALVASARRFLDRQPWSGLGFRSLRVSWRSLLIGMSWWIAPAVASLLVATAAGWVSVEFSRFDTKFVLLAFSLPALVFLYEAFPEELVFRGYIFTTLAARLAGWQAVLIQGALFTAWGVLIGAADSLARIVVFAMFSIVVGLLRLATGDIWASIGFHLAFQSVTQLFSAAVREGALEIGGQDFVEGMAFGLIPVSCAVVVALVLVKRAAR
jgi:membrane protease YdiL (CAAX protease family)